MDPVTNTAVEKESNDTEDLAEFIDVIYVTNIWTVAAAILISHQ